MAAFDMTFDAKEWIRERGLPCHGREITFHLGNNNLGATMQIPSCASWHFPELGVGQGALGQHQGFRGTIADLLEKARADVEMSRGLYGEEAAPKFDAVLKQINRILYSESGDSGTVTLSVRDASGLCGVPADLMGCIALDNKFERSEAENMLLIPLDAPSPGEQLKTVDQIAELVRQATHVVALTGAGISVESGITPFRNPSDGDKGFIWGKFDAGKLTLQNFNGDPEVTEGWWKMKRSLRSELDGAKPNPAHEFFAMLEQMGKLGAVVTQNIDSLHQRAGVPAEKVIELHGHMRGLVCSDHKTLLNPVTFGSGKCTFCIQEDAVEAIQSAYSDSKVPLCPDCGCPLRTETVMFGQPMPLHAVDAACKAINQADLLLVIGSTLIVQPANELPCIAIRNGTPLVIINFDATRYDAYAKGLIREKAGEFLNAVAGEIKQRPECLTPAAPGQQMFRPTAGREAPEELKRMRVIQEGSRRGKDIAVNAKACGTAFFCTAVTEPEGDFELLEQSLAAMNADSFDIGKMLFSDGLDQLCIVAYIPDGYASILTCTDWLQAVSQVIGGTVIESTSTSGKLVVHASAHSHPIKLKDPGITAAISVLKDKGLFLAQDDEDDFIFGDHDFPLT
eukprot:TRINITY_DN45114_c0_g1_i1.p1 TRINITY_DN45114_c0_g1~~TRINITY_DN45114_c0_g1_i1.p1  ORF type:complete len:624 (-),score=108.24 TRINITY_DN45114_c0_g1_i1:68-1939(-)